MRRNVRKHTFRPVLPSKIQISLRIRAVWSEPSLWAYLTAKNANLHVDSEDSDKN